MSYDVCVPIMRAMHDAGYGQFTIAECMGCSRDVVQYRLSRYCKHKAKMSKANAANHRICCNCNSRAWICGALAEMLHLLDDNNDVIAGWMNVSAAWVYTTLKKRGVYDAMRSNRSIYDIDTIRELAEQGISGSEIARRLGYEQTTTCKYLRKIGISKSRDEYNVERAEQARIARTAKAQEYLGDAFTVVSLEGSSHKWRGVIECNVCGTRKNININREFFKYEKHCEVCEDAAKEQAWFDAPKEQMMIHFPAEPHQCFAGVDFDEIRTCVICGNDFRLGDRIRSGKKHTRTDYLTVCSDECQNAKSALYRKRRKKIGTMPWRYVARHYNTNKCYLCGKPVDPNDYRINENGIWICGPDYPSTDHVVAIVNGGDCSIENSRLAHRGCNAMKQAIPLDEFMKMTKGVSA